MNENIDLTKILKNCPKYTKFYSTVLGEINFIEFIYGTIYPIIVSCDDGKTEAFTASGKLILEYDGECVLFPSEDQRDWNKFSAPWYNPEKQDEDKKERNNFDVLPGLYKCVHSMFDGTPDGRLLFEIGNVYKCLSKHDRAEFEVSYGHSVYLEDPVVCKYFIPFESKVEQASSQTNERAWLYLVSDVLTWKDGIGQYLDDTRVQELAKRLCSEYVQKLYSPSNSSNTRKNEQKSADKIEPKFKVGDKIVNIPMKSMGDPWTQAAISEVTNDKYIFTDGSYIQIGDQDHWELAINKKDKFNPNTLKPFDRVLVRDYNDDKWVCSIFSHIEPEDSFHYECILELTCRYCIPYNDETKHLVGTTEEAPEFYRYWED